MTADPGAATTGEPVSGPSAPLAPWAPWAILQHVEHEGPGLLAEVLRSGGQPFDVVRLDLGATVPDADSIGGLVVLGGPMGVHDDAYSWLVPERDLLAATAGAGKPVLGVCLGAQQLAAALGASVTTGPTPEVGLGRVELTGPGRLDPVMGPEYGGLSATSIPCVHWHQDTFDLPDGATHLAATRLFPHQAFRWGYRAYGFQFHVEVHRALADGWEPFLPADTTLDRVGVAEVTTAGRRLLGRFVERSTSAPQRVGPAAPGHPESR